MIWKTAWKNVWRNKTRSMVVIVSVTIGIFAGIYSVAVMNGAVEQRLDSALNEELSHFQISDKNFKDNYDAKFTIKNILQTVEKIHAVEGVEAVSKRVVINGMANTASKSTGVKIIGINPTDEKSVLKLNEKIVPGSGSYFEGDKTNVVYIGESLAKELNIIRYKITDECISRLRDQKVPDHVLNILTPYVDTRFKSEKLFRRELESKFTKSESAKYGHLVVQEAKTFNERAKLTLTFLDKNNNQTGGLFKIAGVFNVNNNGFEQTQVFVLNDELKKLTGNSEDEYHQIMVRINDVELTKEVKEKLVEALPDLKVESWKEISPDVAMMSDMMAMFYGIFMGIILAALAFGIVNTMLMVVLERTKEIGMLSAIGMNKKRLFSMIMLESLFMSSFGGVVGMIVSKLFIVLSAKNGINFSSYAEGFEEMGFSAHIFPVISDGFFFVTILLIILTGILSSVYPALKALKLNPADALRTE